MADASDFFVGWLPMPRSYARFLFPLALAILVVAASTAVFLALGQRSPGAAVWDDAAPRSFEGIVYASPYAMIRVRGETPDVPVRTILLVEEGKFGAAERVRPFDGQAVRVTGTLLHREERWMLELVEGDAGLKSVAMSEEQGRALRRGAPVSLGEVTLRGEIIDSKCYLGAMKPGGGKTHKACAALCLSGGIPPMLVTRDGRGAEVYYLLADPDGGPAIQAVIDHVGDPIEVTGRLERHDDLHVLKVSAAGIRRR
jgi:hypothetical protein